MLKRFPIGYPPIHSLLAIRHPGTPGLLDSLPFQHAVGRTVKRKCSVRQVGNMTKVRGLMNRSHPLVVVLLRELLLVLNPFAPGDARNYALETAEIAAGWELGLCR